MTTTLPPTHGSRKLTREDLFTLEQYATQRSQFRAQVLAHKKRRTLQVGPHATFLFEDRMTVQYQVQEMLRIERIFEASGIADELDAYNPLIPDGSNWKATLLIEYPEVDKRKAALARLIGVEDRCWVRVGEHARVYAIADEDLERENAEKTSSVHFLRFELTREMTDAAKTGAAIGVGIDHPVYEHAEEAVARDLRDALVDDLD